MVHGTSGSSVLGGMMDYRTWFEEVTGFAPHSWQQRIGSDAECTDRFLRIPTGFGKTAGTVLPWLFRRVVGGDLRWPTRLVFCLPMRTLAALPKLAEKTVYAMVQAGEIPAFKIRGQWRIKRTEL